MRQGAGRRALYDDYLDLAFRTSRIFTIDVSVRKSSGIGLYG